MRHFLHFLGSSEVSAALLILVALAIIARYALARRGRKTWPVTVALVLMAATTYLGQMHLQCYTFVTKGPWPTFHYFMGAKYFSELGYFGLYRFVALADQETGTNKLKNLSNVRHLEDYSLMPIDKAIALANADRRSVFADARWEEFKRDWIAVSQRAKSRGWRSMLTDRGFNPPPFWNLLPGALAQYVEIRDAQSFKYVRGFDLLFMLSAFVLLAIFGGIDTALIVFCFVELTSYNATHQVGTYFQFMFLSTLIAAMALYRGGKLKIAGGLFAASAMLRIFPALLMIGPVFAWLKDLLKTRKLPEKNTALIFSFTLFCCLFFLLGLTQGKGIHTTKEFFKNITMHADDQKYDFNKFGLTRTMGEDLLHPGNTPYSQKARHENHQRHRWLYWPLLFALIAMAFSVILKNVDDDAWIIPMGMLFVFAGLTLSRYYYLALVVFLIPGKKRETDAFPTIAGASIFLIHFIFYLLPVDQHTPFGGPAAFAIANYAFILMFLGLPVFLLVRQKHQKQRLLSSRPD